MKNLILDASLKSIKHDKKRYKGSIISIITATFLITIVFNIAYNFRNITIEMQKSRSGDYDFSYIDVSNKEYNDLKSDKDIDEDTISRVYFNTGKVFDELKGVKVDILSCDKTFFSFMNPISLKEGNMPTNGHEVILEEWCSNEYGNNVKIGDKITTENNGVKDTYTVTGFYNNFNTSQYTKKVNFYTIIDRDKADYEIENIFFKLKNKNLVSKSFSKYRNNVGEEHFQANEALLILKGEHESIKNNESIKALMFLLIPSIVIGVIIISNVINISLLQNIPLFGSLRALGANKKFTSKLIMVETMLISVFAIPLGSVLSCILIKLIGCIVGTIENPKISISIMYSLGAAMTSLLIVLISAFIAAKDIRNMNILDAVFSRNQNTLIRKQKNIKINNLEFDISNRSMKMVKRKYRLTLASVIFTSVLVFIYFSAGNMINNIFKVLGEDSKTEYNIYSTADTGGDYEETYKELSSISGVDKLYRNYNLVTGENILINTGDNEYVKMKSIVHVYDRSRLLNSNLQNYLLAGNTEDLENKIIVVKTKATRNLKIGDKIKLFNSDKDLEVGMIISKDPFRGFNDYDEDNEISNYKSDMKIIISDGLYNEVSNKKLGYYGFDLIFKKSIDNEETKNKVKSCINSNLSNMRYIDNTANIRSRENQMKMIFMSLAFILVIIIGTSIIMIYNTTKSNVIMRKKEISMLRAIGMNIKQIKKTILYEALIYAIKGYLISLVIGYILNKIICSKLQSIGPINGNVPLFIPIITLIIIIMVSIISVIPSIKEIKKGRILE